MNKPKITKRGWNITVIGEDENMNRNEVLKKANESIDSDKRFEKVTQDSVKSDKSNN